MSGEFDVEPIPGLPERPPQGEVILWQGSPDWRSLARHVFHIRAVAFYFAVLIAWQFAAAWHDGGTLADGLGPAAMLLAFAFAAIGLLSLLAFAMARAAVYTLTNRRVVMRIGVALPITFNLPFARLQGADLKEYGDGVGDIALSLAPGERLAYLVLWPHVRPWRLKQPQPALRCLKDARSAAALMTQAFAQTQPSRVAVSAPPAPAGERRKGPSGSLSPAAG